MSKSSKEAKALAAEELLLRDGVPPGVARSKARSMYGLDEGVAKKRMRRKPRRPATRLDEDTQDVARAFGVPLQPEMLDASKPLPVVAPDLQRALRHLAIASVIHLRRVGQERVGVDAAEDEKRLREVQSILRASAEVGDDRLGYYRDLPLLFDADARIFIRGNEVVAMELEHALSDIIQKLQGPRRGRATIKDEQLAVAFSTYLADKSSVAGFRYHPYEILKALEALKRDLGTNWVAASRGPRAAAAALLAKCEELFWRPTPLGSPRTNAQAWKRRAVIRDVLRERAVSDEAVVRFVLLALGLDDESEKELRARIMKALSSGKEHDRYLGDPSGIGRTRFPG